jgi:hypothetical protein
MTDNADRIKKLREDFAKFLETQNSLFQMATDALKPGVPQERRNAVAEALNQILRERKK